MLALVVYLGVLAAIGFALLGFAFWFLFVAKGGDEDKVVVGGAVAFFLVVFFAVTCAAVKQAEKLDGGKTQKEAKP